MHRAYSVCLDWCNLTNGWTNNDFIHAAGREIRSCASGAGASFKAGVTTRF